MLGGVTALALLTSLTSGGYAEQIAEHVRKASHEAKPTSGSALFEVDLASDGQVKSARISRAEFGHSNEGLKEILRNARQFPSPPEEQREGSDVLRCLVDIVVRARMVAAVCLTPSGHIDMSGMPPDSVSGRYQLFAALDNLRKGNIPRALASARRAQRVDKSWALGALVMGLARAQNGDVTEAENLLRRYVRNHGYFKTDEVFTAGVADWEEDPALDVAASEVFQGCQRSNEDLLGFVEARMPSLQVCMDEEMERTGGNRELPKRVTFTFVVKPTGLVTNIQVGHRFFREGKLHHCVIEVLNGNLGPVEGTDCPGSFGLDVNHIRYTKTRQ